MTQVTPPGWYPDPGQTSDAPASERWWDGGAWTDRTRPADPAAAWGPPTPSPAFDDPAYRGAYGGAPYPGAPPVPARRGARVAAAVAVGVLVLAGIGGGVYALTGHDGRAASSEGARKPGGPDGFGGSGGRGGQDGQGGQGDPFGGQDGQGGSGGSGGSDSGPGQPRQEDGFAGDPFNGISIPVPDGWSGGTIQGGAQVTSQGSYKCPGDTSKTCSPGGAYSASAKDQGLTATTSRAAAEQDIAKNAQESYGGSSYGGITSHQVLASKAVTVAGEQGYMVRWKAVTSKGADGYVESLVFPSPVASGRLVVVRFGVDADTKGPGLSVLDRITQGIKASSAGGPGQTV
ncbi:DUF2510 domain-containing protein [Streptomyces sp. NPDC048664]|uniref:DUF2510 domain-containing protein n=1 Tax=Streptomyces sp. NPDC048664 TaxID=3154505 RepID=UPI0034284FFB